MSRKDYRLIASALHDAVVNVSDYETGIFIAANHIASALANDNPRFDKERFLRAVSTGKDSRKAA